MLDRYLKILKIRQYILNIFTPCCIVYFLSKNVPTEQWHKFMQQRATSYT